MATRIGPVFISLFSSSSGEAPKPSSSPLSNVRVLPPRSSLLFQAKGHHDALRRPALPTTSCKALQGMSQDAHSPGASTQTWAAEAA
eukprot:CAMPEP_0115145802 /NCGR_PEP_ID=MMETSP0227-20121206/62336_1 /TAXON_ID=89957 /ORGANISM="Polarella glacialis, Strain CCMP 1383" /LENGTH=86 /DNA_ID=CAMNT_0002555397 /DNA_START=430 /DNA_END=688 /DNA_ORIENTATION=+